MAYTMVRSGSVEFAVDWGVVERLTLSYWKSYYQLFHSKKTDMSESSWYNPFSWALPTTTTIDVDWPRVRAEAHAATARDMIDFAHWASYDMRGVAREVEFRLGETAINRRRFTDNLKAVQQKNAAAIEESVDDYDGLIEASKFVRDTSADIVIIGSTIATGGAAAGLLVGGSAMKGAFKYQDTGSAGAAVLYGGGTLVLGAFRVGGAKIGGDYTLIVAKGVLETGTSLVAGDSFGTALGKGTLKVASAGSAQMLFGAAPVKKVFERMPVPFNVWSLTSRDGANVMFTDVSNKMVEKMAKKGTEKGAKYGIKAVFSSPEEQPARRTSAGVADEVPVESKLLLYFGIVNMQKGIGHGW